MIETDVFGTYLLIAIMALVTLVTRWGGVFIMSYVPIGFRVEQFIKAMSGSVLVAVVAPIAMTGDTAARLGLVTTSILVLTTRSVLPAIIAGIVMTGLYRYFI